MSIFEAVSLGIVQGLTEFFPVSSSGHLVLFQSLFGIEEPQLAFDIFLHLGTLAAVVIFFSKDIIALFSADRRKLFFIIIASIPTFIIGALFKDIVEEFFSAPVIVAYMLLVTGLWLIFAHISTSRARPDDTKPLGIFNSLMVGIAQGVAVMPGISRSGSTIGTGIILGMDREEACRFSFLLSIPAVAGASVVKGHKIISSLFGPDTLLFIAGGLAAMITGFFSIKVLLKVIRGSSLAWFGAYCILIGSFLLIALTR